MVFESYSLPPTPPRLNSAGGHSPPECCARKQHTTYSLPKLPELGLFLGRAGFLITHPALIHLLLNLSLWVHVKSGNNLLAPNPFSG